VPLPYPTQFDAPFPVFGVGGTTTETALNFFPLAAPNM